MNEAEIIAESARRAMALPGLNAQDRKTARSRIEGELRAEASAKAAVVANAAAVAEASAERARIAAVFREGERVGKPRQALKLALAGPLDAHGARVVLATLLPDRSAPAAFLAFPDAGAFGSAAAQAERARIAAILGGPEATGRDATALAFAFDTNLDAETAALALAGVVRIQPYAGKSIAERSAKAGDFGHQPTAPGAKQTSGASALWSKAIREVNAGLDVGGDTSLPGAQSEATRSAELFAQVEKWRIEEGR